MYLGQNKIIVRQLNSFFMLMFWINDSAVYSQLALCLHKAVKPQSFNDSAAEGNWLLYSTAMNGVSGNY